MNARGYQGILQHLDSSRCGAATWGTFLVIFWVSSTTTSPGQMASLRQELGTIGLTRRGFDNCLKPVGVARQCFIRKGRILEVNTLRENHLGTCQGSPVVDPSGPAILNPAVVISTPKGLRRLEISEWLKIKGLPPDLPVTRSELKDLVQLPGVQEWSAVGDRLMELSTIPRTPFSHPPDPPVVPPPPPDRVAPPTATPPAPEEPDPMPPPKAVPLDMKEQPTSVFDFPEPPGPWSWEIPDLSEVGQFFKDRLTKLREVVAKLDGPNEWIEQGILDLAKHRTNYGATGPENLTILWWECPPSIGLNSTMAPP
jgi:hypothetical protein